jgi:hypothetical protein
MISNAVSRTTRCRHAALLLVVLMITAIVACAIHADDDDAAMAHDLCAGSLLGAMAVIAETALAVGRFAVPLPPMLSAVPLHVLDPPPKPRSA